MNSLVDVLHFKYSNATNDLYFQGLLGCALIMAIIGTNRADRHKTVDHLQFTGQSNVQYNTSSLSHQLASMNEICFIVKFDVVNVFLNNIFRHKLFYMTCKSFV